MSTKKNILILCGGVSSEHKVSLLSAVNVMNAIDMSKFNPILVSVDLNNNWKIGQLDELILNHGDSLEICLNDKSEIVSLARGIKGDCKLSFLNNSTKIDIDLVFPVMHGNNVEDGILQGYLSNIGVKYVGCGVLASSLCMDKDICHKILKESGIPTVDFVTVLQTEIFEDGIKKVISYFDNIYPLFVKPANGGSSVGISKVSNHQELETAIKLAFEYDKKVVIEKAIIAREIEIAILGNTKLVISEPGEIVVKSDFYDYDTKYLGTNSSYPLIPANLDPEQTSLIKKYARDAYITIGCRGLSRIDFFIEEGSKQIYLNEINTMPGFTSVSMYPKLMGQIGISYTELITRLINLGLED